MGDYAWATRSLDEKKAINLFNQLLQVTNQLYTGNSYRWAEKHASVLRTLALFFRWGDKKKALGYYKAALDIAELERKKFPNKWKKKYKKYLNDYHSFYRYELNFLDKVRYRVKGFFKKKKTSSKK